MKQKALISLLILIQLYSSGILIAQQAAEVIPDRSRNRFSLNFTAFSANRLEFEPAPDDYLKSKRAFSGEIGINYDFYQSTNFFFSAGFGVGSIPFSYEINIPAEDIIALESQGADGANFNEYILLYFNFPVTMNYIFARNEKSNWQLSGGISYSRIFWEGYSLDKGLSIGDDANLETYQLFKMYLHDTISASHFNVIFGLGNSRSTKNDRSWTIGLVSQLGLRPVGTGDFKFTNVAVPSTGTVRLGFNYIGIRTAYGFRPRLYREKEAAKRLKQG